ncbi:MAG: potassium channel family protein [Patescibacteria group bacterium]
MIFFSVPQELIKRYRFRKVFLSLITVAVFMGILVVPFEVAEPGSSIKNLGDGLWWASATVTTVGYGDVVPVTAVGRIIGVILQISGILLYSSLIGMVTVYVNRTQTEYNWQRLFTRLDQIEGELREIKKQSGFLINEKSKKS